MSVDLSYNTGLNGYVPSQLALLTVMTSLNLIGNSFAGYSKHHGNRPAISRLLRRLLTAIPFISIFSPSFPFVYFLTVTLPKHSRLPPSPLLPPAHSQHAAVLVGQAEQRAQEPARGGQCRPLRRCQRHRHGAQVRESVCVSVCVWAGRWVGGWVGLGFRAGSGRTMPTSAAMPAPSPRRSGERGPGVWGGEWGDEFNCPCVNKYVSGPTGRTQPHD